MSTTLVQSTTTESNIVSNPIVKSDKDVKDIILNDNTTTLTKSDSKVDKLEKDFKTLQVELSNMKLSLHGISTYVIDKFSELNELFEDEHKKVDSEPLKTIDEDEELAEQDDENQEEEQGEEDNQEEENNEEEELKQTTTKPKMKLQKEKEAKQKLPRGRPKKVQVNKKSQVKRK